MYGPGDHNPLSPARTGRTATDIAASKGERRLAMLTAYDYPTALALDGCGLDLILVGDSLGEVELGFPSTRDVSVEMMCHHIRAVAHGATRTHIVGDMPADSYRTPDEAVATATRLVEAGADSVKLEGAMVPEVLAIIDAGIPVMGHVGLLPQTHEERRRRGKTPEEAEAINADAIALAEAGCYAIVIEAVDPEVSGRITAAVGVPTIGIAAGAETDGQVLVSTDLIGQLPEPPRFVTPKANVFQTVIDAGVAFAREVRGEVPAGTRS
ncbi:MAG: 3-methyl-2-oxobutanoate hydroxymethyltransferase [Actinobacteria bacterium]|nr:3-methyl-2-oxobutanoate hydroxymethyltransferase [Thermoleophilia bacterium]MCB9012110.1 3-methyl-2-oxobutanoate hydroxymethyltransferase [Actinomycetota bacterium]